MRRRLSVPARRAQIVATAREVFGEAGYAGTHLRTVAERAGITPPILYRHFSSKEALYQEAFLDPLDTFLDGLTAATHEMARQPDAAPIEVLQRFHELFLAHLSPIAPLLAASRFCPTHGEQTYYEAVLVPRVSALMDEIFPDLSGIPSANLDMDVIARALVGLYFAMVVQTMMDGREVDVPMAAAQLTLMFGPGLLPSSERRPTSAPLPPGLGTFSLEDVPTAAERPQIPRAERRRMVQHAARAAFFQSGKGATSKDIAKRAGITEAFLYRLFDSKDELYTESVERPVVHAFGEYLDQVRTLSATRSGPEFLFSLNELGIRFFAVHAPITATALYSDLAAGKRFYSTLRPTLDELRTIVVGRLGELNPELDHELVHRAIMGAHMGLGFDGRLAGRPDEIHLVAAKLTAIFTGGVRRAG
jgi:AcrR family transcriptional regulator